MPHEFDIWKTRPRKIVWRFDRQTVRSTTRKFQPLGHAPQNTPPLRVVCAVLPSSHTFLRAPRGMYTLKHTEVQCMAQNQKRVNFGAKCSQIKWRCTHHAHLAPLGRLAEGSKHFPSHGKGQWVSERSRRVCIVHSSLCCCIIWSD